MNAAAVLRDLSRAEMVEEKRRVSGIWWEIVCAEAQRAPRGSTTNEPTQDDRIDATVDVALKLASNSGAILDRLAASHPTLAATVRDGWIVLCDGPRETRLAHLDRVPLVHRGLVDFQVENVLASAAAAWRLGVPLELVRLGLESFSSGSGGSPGRFNLLDLEGASIVVDYGHNVPSLEQICATIRNLPHVRRTAVYSAAGDRRDEDLVEQGKLLAATFDRVVIYGQWQHGELVRLDKKTGERVEIQPQAEPGDPPPAGRAGYTSRPATGGQILAPARGTFAGTGVTAPQERPTWSTRSSSSATSAQTPSCAPPAAAWRSSPFASPPPTNGKARTAPGPTTPSGTPSWCSGAPPRP
jgi:hypothetical protein